MVLEPKPVKGYEGQYHLDPDIMQVVNTKTGKVKKSRPDKGGYPEVQLYKNNHREHKYLHIMFAEAYVPNPDNLPEVNHKDEDPTNWNPDNLEWCTHKYNMNYGTINERRGRNISKAKTGVPQPWIVEQKGIPVIGIDTDGHECYYESAKTADRDLGLCLGSVSKVIYGYRKTAGGYKWRKANPDEIR